MTGITDLQQLIRSMQPELREGLWVFCVTDNSIQDCLELEPIVTVNEREGLSLVISQAKADEFELEYQGVYKMITLNVHSSLEAVGLTAAFAKCLTEQGISSNVIAGYFHDHIFVPAAVADKAMSALQALAADH